MLGRMGRSSLPRADGGLSRASWPSLYPNMVEISAGILWDSDGAETRFISRCVTGAERQLEAVLDLLFSSSNDIKSFRSLCGFPFTAPSHPLGEG